MRKEGKITFWNYRKGYGFIEPLDGSKQVFVHIRSFSDRQERPKLEQQVSYTLSEDKRGRVCAVDVGPQEAGAAGSMAGKGKLLLAAAVIVPIVVLVVIFMH